MNLNHLMEKNPYCQIASKEIMGQTCLEMQGQEGCFGCAAPTRLCEVCKDELVAVPAVGLGSGCLGVKLSEEKRINKPDFATNATVQCQIFKKTIAVDMCLATQGQEGCRNCSVPSRLCEKCQMHPCRFPKYGLCLTCSVEEFGEGWKPGEKPKEHEGAHPVVPFPRAETRVLAKHRDQGTNPDTKPGMQQKTSGKLTETVGKLEELLKIVGENSKFGEAIKTAIWELRKL